MTAMKTKQLISKRYTPGISELSKRANKTFDYSSTKKFRRRINKEYLRFSVD